MEDDEKKSKEYGEKDCSFEELLDDVEEEDVEFSRRLLAHCLFFAGEELVEDGGLPLVLKSSEGQREVERGHVPRFRFKKKVESLEHRVPPGRSGV